MEDQANNRTRMLEQIRNALGRTAVTPEPLPPFDSHVPAKDNASLVETFSRELEKVGGRVTWARSTEELHRMLEELSAEHVGVAVSAGEVLDQLGLRPWLILKGKQLVPSFKETGSLDRYKRLLVKAELGITTADYALADTGTLVLVSGNEQHRLISLLPPVHVCLLDPRRIFASLTDFLANGFETSQPPSAMTCITGPSRTADIELTITTGIHGPRTLEVILYSSEN